MQKVLVLAPLTLLSLVVWASLAAAQANSGTTTTQARSSASPASGDSATTGAGEKSIENSSVELPPEKAHPVTIARFDKAPVIDGRLDDEPWKQAAVLKDFYQIRPGDNIAPSKPTEVLLGYDDKSLYIAFHAYDEPGKVRATVAKRDDVTDDDNVRIMLDTYNDQRRAYILMFNPLGVQQDGIFTEGRDEDYSVDLVMDSKGMLTDDGYTVEVAIPFKSLRYQAGKEKLWGIHVYRQIKRFDNELDSWMPISRDKAGLLNQEGHIRGLEHLATGRTLEIIPNLTLIENGNRVRTLPPTLSLSDPLLLDPGRFINEPVRHDLGVTAKLGISPNITLDFTYNPDFAQIEADQPVVTVNQRFPIFYEEKRPFFLEGIDIFQTPLKAVHTRAIIDPEFAIKLTGKSGRNTFGALIASDNGPGNFTGDERLDPQNFPFLDKNAFIGVLRLKHDVGKDSNIGLMATSYNFVAKYNQLAGVDGRLRIDKQTFFSFQVLGTTTRGTFFDADAGGDLYRRRNGLGYYFTYEKSQRHLSYSMTGEGRTRSYRADVGFTLRTNTNLMHLLVRYESEPKPKAKLIAWHALNSLRSRFDWQGRLQSWTNETQASIDLRRQTNIGIGFESTYERLFEEEFGPKRTATRPGAFFGPDNERSAHRQSPYVFVSMTPTKKYSFSLIVDYTINAFDFDFGAGPKFQRVSPAALLDANAPLDPGTGNALDIVGNIKYKPTDLLSFSLDYTKSSLVRHDTRRVAYDDNIYTLRSTYQFTRFIFARARLDYDTLYSKMNSQFLLGWTPNPGTAFYVGYNDDLNRNGFNPFTGQPEPGFRRNSRAFFIKMSYLFRRSL